MLSWSPGQSCLIGCPLSPTSDLPSARTLSPMKSFIKLWSKLGQEPPMDFCYSDYYITNDLGLLPWWRNG